MLRICLFRPVGALSAFLLLIGGLAACSDDGDAAAKATAEAYVDLIATGNSEELDTLAELTLTSDGDALVTAAEALAAAEERIEVLALGAIREAESVPLNMDAGAIDRSFLATTVTYRLSGNTYEGEVVLAPYADGDRDDPDTWVVVEPLTGTLVTTPEATNTSGLLMDRFVAGVSVESDDVNHVYRAPLYPGVYELDRRLDPYLASPTETLTITAGDEIDEPVAEIMGTEETTPVVTNDLVDLLEACPNQRCPDRVSPLVHPHGVDDIWSGDWVLDVIVEPEVVLEGENFRFSGGELRIGLSDGTTVDLPVEGSGGWGLDHLSGEPLITLQEITESPTSS